MPLGNVHARRLAGLTSVTPADEVDLAIDSTLENDGAIPLLQLTYLQSYEQVRRGWPYREAGRLQTWID